MLCAVALQEYLERKRAQIQEECVGVSKHVLSSSGENTAETAQKIQRRKYSGENTVEKIQLRTSRRSTHTREITKREDRNGSKELSRERRNIWLPSGNFKCCLCWHKHRDLVLVITSPHKYGIP